METVIAPDVPLPTAPDDELESPTRQLTGWPARIATVLAVGLSLYALYRRVNRRTGGRNGN